MGITYEKLKDYKKAEEAYLKALEFSPDEVDACYNLGLVYIELKEYDKAIDCFNRVLDFDDKDSNSYFNIGIANFKKGDLIEALDNFQKTVELNDGDIYAHFYIGNIFKEFGDNETASYKFNKVLEISPDYSWAYYNLAVIAYEDGDLDATLDFLDKTLELNPKDKNSSINMFSKIDLGECENKLREHYNLNKNISLIILKYEKISNLSSERKLQYEVYESLNKTRLNLSVCKDIKIDIYVPVILSEKILNLQNELKNLGYDLFDINNKFYQDICTPYKSENGTDVLLSDRINYFYNNEETQCQPNCQLSGYFLESQNIKCKCEIIENDINVENKQEEEAKSIYKSFYDILKYSNYKVLKCFKLAFNVNIFSNDKGNILTFIYFFIYLLLFIIYLIKGTALLMNDLSKLIINNKTKEKNEIEKPMIINCKKEIITKNNNIKQLNSPKNSSKIIAVNINYKNDKKIQNNKGKKKKNNK